MLRHTSIDGLSKPRPLGSGFPEYQAPLSLRFLTVAARIPRPAFSLLELMIGIVILGFGLVMVATMFPVAWSRARTLSQYTVERAITQNAHTTVRALVRVSGPSRIASSFESDLLFQPDLSVADLDVPKTPLVPIAACAAFPTDTSVHALNLENIQVLDRQFVNEDTWLREGGDLYDAFLNIAGPAIEQSFFYKRISFHERLFPPMDRRSSNDFTAPDPRWDDVLDTRRFAWSVLYRLRDIVPFSLTDTSAPGSTRSFDMYYVTLRRGQPAFRYARQKPDSNSLPDPCLLSALPVTPAAMDPDKDVMFPVPWRVQVQFPNSIVLGALPTGIPTEIEVPPDGGSFDASETLMFIQMFQRGTRFIDEINGQVYEVIDQRVSSDADKATLTLDREVLFDDLHIPNADPRCEPCDDTQLIDLELLRTVWVFPPPVEPRSAADAPVIFNGSPPAIAIDIRTLSVASN